MDSIKEIIKKVRHTIVRHNMIIRGDRVIVAVSGGPDSVCLLDILVAFRTELVIELVVAHFNHGLRPDEDEAETRFVKSLAASVKLPFETKKADQSKVLSYIKLSNAINECKETKGDLYDKAGVLLKELIRAHAFVSGNRRTAFITTLDFVKKNKDKSLAALKRLKDTARAGENIFAEMMNTVKHCTLGQITQALYEVGGKYRRNM